MWRGLALVRWMIMAGRIGLQTAHDDHFARVQVYNIYCIAPPFSIQIHIPPLFFHPPPLPLGLLPSESTTPTFTAPPTLPGRPLRPRSADCEECEGVEQGFLEDVIPMREFAWSGGVRRGLHLIRDVGLLFLRTCIRLISSCERTF